jgi:hypothetical protein
MKRSLAFTLLLSTLCSGAFAQAVAPEAPVSPSPAEATPGEAMPPQSQASAEPLPAAADPASAPEAAPVAEMAELSQAELEALGFGGGEQAKNLDTDLHLFGFADFGIVAPVLPKSSAWYGAAFDKHRSLYIGNFNLYLAKNISETVRTMGEVRFLYLPNGARDQASGALNSTAVADYGDFSRPLRWGGVEIERVYLEWDALSHLSLRAGQFLTPYGIWNVDHGSPTFIPVQRPFVVGSSWFPERQTGFEFFGKYDVGTQQTLGYHLTISNGQGLSSEYRDLDANKAVGGRAFWEYRGFGQLRIGASGYYGTLTDALLVPGLKDGNVTYTERIVTQRKNLALAMDVLWNYKNLRMQAELLSHQAVYTDEGRVQVASALTGRSNYPADQHSWGGYFLTGYRFDWFGVMPYGVLQYINQVDPGTAVITRLVSFDVGLNVRPIDAVVVKLSFTESHFPDGIYVTKDPVRMIMSQVAWAF